MSGQAMGVSTLLPGVAGVALLPSTGTTNVLFTVALGLLCAGLVTLLVSTISARKSNSEEV